MRQRFDKYAFITLLLVCIISCHKRRFLESPSLLKSGKYFQKEYKKAGVNFSQYKFVYVEPINLDFIEEASSIRSDYLSEDLEQLNRLFLHNIKKALWKKYIPVSKVRSKKDTLVMKVAITKMKSLQDGDPKDSKNPLSRLLGLRESRTEIEMMFFDSQTGDLIAEIYDSKIITEKRSRPVITDPWESTKKNFVEYGIKLEEFMK